MSTRNTSPVIDASDLLEDDEFEDDTELDIDVVVVEPAPARAEQKWSQRLPWLRPAFLAALAVCTVFPWMTSTGCQGDQPPETWTGAGLLWDSLRDTELLWAGPVCLLLASIAGFALHRLRRPSRLLAAHLGVLALVLVGGFFTLVAFEAPLNGDVIDHHVACYIGEGLLLLLGVDALARFALATREWWRSRPAPSKPVFVSSPM